MVKIKDANKMTPEELRALADEKEKSPLPVKQGFLKHDLYYLDKELIKRELYNLEWLVTKEEINTFFNSLQCLKEPDLYKGEKFDYYDDEDGGWFDTSTGTVAAAGDDFAEQHLENIGKWKKGKVKK